MTLLVFLQASGPSVFGSFLPILLIFVVLYFFFLRPQAKKQKEQSKFLESLEKGEEVVTSSGMIGRINKLEGNIITLMIAEKTFIRVTKGSISKEMTEAYRKSESSSAESASS
ncbi:MAG TPA: preprotein translocase subunit YajC [Saprospiraceae bacterium]|nr:preprotein translocase subunit YajC [Saprospiraceae bacterium]